MKSNELTSNIIRYIKLEGGQAERVNNIARKINGRFVRSNMTKGTADIHATIPIKIKDKIFGLSVKIEVKIAKDKQSIFQKEYQKEVEKAGGIYYIAKDYHSFYRWYNQNFK